MKGLTTLFFVCDNHQTFTEEPVSVQYKSNWAIAIVRNLEMACQASNLQFFIYIYMFNELHTKQQISFSHPRKGTDHSSQVIIF